MPLDLQQLPKVLLHEHLDGGLRPQTVIDLAKAIGYAELPTDNAAELGAWLRAAGLQLEDVSGLAYDPVRRSARVGGGTSVNYLACAVKP